MESKMYVPRVGTKIWLTLNDETTNPWLTREQARKNRMKDDVLIEVPLTVVQQRKIQSIMNSIVGAN